MLRSLVGSEMCIRDRYVSQDSSQVDRTIRGHLLLDLLEGLGPTVGLQRLQGVGDQWPMLPVLYMLADLHDQRIHRRIQILPHHVRQLARRCQRRHKRVRVLAPQCSPQVRDQLAHNRRGLLRGTLQRPMSKPPSLD
eukprot:TRINITY_DN2178_c0_g1_i9.p1 TRINITY_DN2178_c0_g1~~TRINITY_DN2178_c0_g1_i9.p1  ORF type:complete len:158 (-),score=42.32 TRINITY_DN2178_c0_g1_i9:412-822(-)